VNRPIVLVGLPGAGKSTVGRALAKRLNLPFADSDRDIERLAQRNVTEIFETEGEARFRTFERHVVGELIVNHMGVIALGGGAFVDDQIRAAVRKHCLSIWLDVPPQVIDARLQGNDRPLLAGPNQAQALDWLNAVRRQYYETADIRVADAPVNEMVASIERSISEWQAKLPGPDGKHAG
jgi:shikimate kinase